MKTIIDKLLRIDFINEFIINSKNEKDRRNNLIKILSDLDIDFKFNNFDNGVNIYNFGDSNIYLCAHYDVVNYKFCYLDNTISVFILMFLKKKYKELNIILTDKEEPPHLGLGIKNFLQNIKKKSIIFNLDVLGGGEWLAYDSICNNLFLKKIMDDFSVYCESMPYSDGLILTREKFNTATISSINKDRTRNFWSYCHTERDDLNNIKEENIINNCKLIDSIILYILDNYGYNIDENIF